MPGGTKKSRAPKLETSGMAPDLLDTVPAQVKDVMYRLGPKATQQEAKRILTYQTQYPGGTIPELLTLDWLRLNQYPHEYQVELYGGRRVAGGLVPDFIVDAGPMPWVWQIDGDYWHSAAFDLGTKDAAADMRYMASQYRGRQIGGVVHLKESDILRLRPWVFLQAVAGIGI